MTLVPFPKQPARQRVSDDWDRRARAIQRVRDWLASSPAAVPAPTYVQPRSAAPDVLLRLLARGWPEAAYGEIPPHLTQEIANALPDIAQELLSHRAAQDVRTARSTQNET